jgi:hypothetical protein
MGGGGSKGGGQKPAYTPKYSGLLEDVLTGQGLGMMLKNNPASAGFLKPYQGSGMIGQGQGQGQKGTDPSSKSSPYRFQM